MGGVTDVSLTISFPDKRVPDKTIAGQDVSWTSACLTRRLFPVQDVSRTITLPDRRLPDRRFPKNLYK